MIMAGINGVNLVANNVNNRRNNNNNNNNENNDNSVQLNEADTEGDIDAVNPPIVLPPVVGKRRRSATSDPPHRSSPPPPLSRAAVSASLAWLRAASAAAAADQGCLSRAVCEVSRELRGYPAAFGLVVTLGIAQSTGTADAESLLRAARTGRRATAALSACATFQHVSASRGGTKRIGPDNEILFPFQACPDATFAALTLASQQFWLHER